MQAVGRSGGQFEACLREHRECDGSLQSCRAAVQSTPWPCGWLRRLNDRLPRHTDQLGRIPSRPLAACRPNGECGQPCSRSAQREQGVGDPVWHGRLALAAWRSAPSSPTPYRTLAALPSLVAVASVSCGAAIGHGHFFFFASTRSVTYAIFLHTHSSQRKKFCSILGDYNRQGSFLHWRGGFPYFFLNAVIKLVK